MTGAAFLGIRPASAAAWASAASKRSMWRSVAKSEKASAASAEEPSALTRRPAIVRRPWSDVEEHGFFGPAEMDRQSPAAAVVAPGDQRVAPRRLDHPEHGIFAKRRIAVEIEPRRQPVEQAAGEQRHVDVRRLQAALRPWHAAGLDGGEMAAAVGEGRGAAIAFEARVEWQVAAIVGMVVAAVAVGLPDLEQAVGHDVAVGIVQLEDDLDALAGDAGGREI